MASFTTVHKGGIVSYMEVFAVYSIKRICIDRLEEIDLNNLKAEDLNWHFGTGQAISKGYGRDKVHSYRHGVQTPIGDIELSVWIKAAEYVVERDGLQEEVKRMTPYMRYHGNHLDIYTHTLDACLSKLYANIEWVDFIEYNEKYHPELLDLWDNRDE